MKFRLFSCKVILVSDPWGFPWGSRDNMRRQYKQPAASKPHSKWRLWRPLWGININVLSQFCRSFAAWFYLFTIDLFLQNIFDVNFLYFLCLFTNFLNYSATLCLFLRRCLLVGRSSISRSFLSNRERLLVFERREARCVKIICLWLQYENQPRYSSIATFFGRYIITYMYT